jgi:hypothetical protein
MADKTIDIAVATNHFGLGSQFNAQKSTKTTRNEYAMVKDANGNEQCESAALNIRTDYTEEAAYCNASPDIKTDLATFLTTFGNFQTVGVVTQLEIMFESGKQARVIVTGHQHAENAHAAGLALGYADVSAALSSGWGMGVPTMAGVTLDQASPISMKITFKMDHKDREGGAGSHWVGKNITPTAELEITYVGKPSVTTVTGWTEDESAEDDSNEDADGYTYRGHRYFDLAAV